VGIADQVSKEGTPERERHPNRHVIVGRFEHADGAGERRAVAERRAAEVGIEYLIRSLKSQIRSSMSTGIRLERVMIW
jgi:dsRNA-specific ribonuclease